jgi:hypothetical protein
LVKSAIEELFREMYLPPINISQKTWLIIIQEVSMKTAHIFGIEAGIIVEQWEIADQLELLRHAEVISFN